MTYHSISGTLCNDVFDEVQVLPFLTLIHGVRQCLGNQTVDVARQNYIGLGCNKPIRS